jgi:malonyl-CoA O-methyltransferase
LGARAHFALADFDQAPVTPGSVSLVTANMALQWSPDLQSTLSKFYDHLEPGGMLGFSIPDAQSFGDLRDAIARANAPDFLNQFVSSIELESSLRDWEVISIVRREFQQNFDTVLALLKGFKAIGGNYRTGSDRAPLTRKDIKAIQSHYPRGCVPLSWSITNVIARKFPLAAAQKN